MDGGRYRLLPVAEVFYETLALAAFALLGLWWVVVADRRREWVALPYRRRQAYSVSPYFTLTGIMSLVSLISGKQPELWRLAFGISGGLGATELVLSLIYARGEPARERRGLRWRHRRPGGFRSTHLAPRGSRTKPSSRLSSTAYAPISRRRSTLDTRPQQSQSRRGFRPSDRLERRAGANGAWDAWQGPTEGRLEKVRGRELPRGR
jgi:hypothetical protein